MECKKLLKKLKLKGYLVSEGELIPIGHRDVINITNIKNKVVVVKLEDMISSKIIHSSCNNIKEV